MTLFLIMSISCIIIGAIVCSNINVVLGDKLEVDQYSEAKNIFPFSIKYGADFSKKYIRLQHYGT